MQGINMAFKPGISSMKSTLFTVAAFISGILFGLSPFLPYDLARSHMVEYLVYLLIFLVGVNVGSNVEVWAFIKRVHFKVFLVPLTVIIGTLAGTALFSAFLPGLSVKDSVTVGLGFGYYSLSSVIITQLDGEELGIIALLANLMREIATLLFAPFFARVFGRLAPIVSGGATAMDTTLPVIVKSSGEEYTVVALFSGMILTLLVPILIPFFLRITAH